MRRYTKAYNLYTELKSDLKDFIEKFSSLMENQSVPISVLYNEKSLSNLETLTFLCHDLFIHIKTNRLRHNIFKDVDMNEIDEIGLKYYLELPGYLTDIYVENQEAMVDTKDIKHLISDAISTIRDLQEFLEYIMQ